MRRQEKGEGVCDVVNSGRALPPSLLLSCQFLAKAEKALRTGVYGNLEKKGNGWSSRARGGAGEGGGGGDTHPVCVGPATCCLNK